MCRQAASLLLALVSVALTSQCSASLLNASIQSATPAPSPTIANTSVHPADTQNQAQVSWRGSTGQPVAESVEDLKRMAAAAVSSEESAGDKRQHTLVTSANQVFNTHTQLFDGVEGPLLASQSQMPAGRRRLDESPNSALLDLPNVDPAAFLRPETLMTAAAAHRLVAKQSRGRSAYEAIVDDGRELAEERYPSPELVAKLANDNYNRVALASAMRLQQAAAQKQLRHQQMASNSMRRKSAARRSSSSSKGAGRPAAVDSRSRPVARARGSQVSSSQRRSAAGRTGARGLKRMGARPTSVDGDGDDEAASEERAGEYDELDGRSDDDAADEDERAESERRQSGSDPIYGDLDSDKPDPELEALDQAGDSADADAGASQATRDNSRAREARQHQRHRQQQQQQRRRSDVAREGRASRPQHTDRQQGQLNRASSSAWSSAASRPRGSRPSAMNGGDERDDVAESMNSRGEQLRADDATDAGSSRRAGQSEAEDDHYDDDQYVRRAQSVAETDDNIDNNRQPARATNNRELAGGRNLDELAPDLAAAAHVRHSATDLQTAAGHHHGHHGHYYQYVEVPKKKAWKFGFKRGNHKHTIEKHEKGHKNKFHTEFKWHAKEKCKKKSKCKSVGKMTWDYKHHDKKHHHG